MLTCSGEEKTKTAYMLTFGNDLLMAIANAFLPFLPFLWMIDTAYCLFEW